MAGHHHKGRQTWEPWPGPDNTKWSLAFSHSIPSTCPQAGGARDAQSKHFLPAAHAQLPNLYVHAHNPTSLPSSPRLWASPFCRHWQREEE